MTDATTDRTPGPMTAGERLIHNERVKFLASMSERIGTGILLVGGLGSMVKLGYDGVAAHAAKASVAKPEFYFMFALASFIYAFIFYVIGYQILKSLKL